MCHKLGVVSLLLWQQRIILVGTTTTFNVACLSHARVSGLAELEMLMCGVRRETGERAFCGGWEGVARTMSGLSGLSASTLGLFGSGRLPEELAISPPLPAQER